jgi:hypothetical protein
LLDTDDHVAIRKLSKFGWDRKGAAGTGGRPIVCWRAVGVDVPLLEGIMELLTTAWFRAGGVYEGKVSGNGFVEW